MKTSYTTKPFLLDQLRHAVWSVMLAFTMVCGTPRVSASITNAPPALSFAQNPRSQVVVSNSSASLSVTPSGTQPLTYRWFRNGLEIAGATNRNFTTPKAQPEHDGLYHVVIRNAYGAVTSLVANLSVIPRATSMAPNVFTNASKSRLPYRIFVPTNMEPGVQYPLVLFLHGIGERGSDNLNQVQANPQFMSFVSYRNQADAPLFLAAPQCPSSRTWADAVMIPLLAEFLDALIRAYPVDTNQIIVTGLSMGGYGSWSLIEYRPDFFAAALPVCGGGNVARCALFRHVPVWNFHAADDGSVPIAESRNLINALRRVGGRPIYTEYRSGGHGIWANAYATPGMVEWALAQHRGERSIIDPQLRIQLPAANGTWETGADRLAMAGTASWGPEVVSQVTWTNLALKAGGQAVGTSLWTVEGAVVKPGQTNQLIVLASSHSFAPALGGATTFSDTLEVCPVSPIIMSLTWQAENVILNWTGGKGPFQLQTRSNLSDGDWTTLSLEATAPWITPSTGGTGFFRIVGN